MEVFQVTSKAFSGWCFVQLEPQWEIEHGKCRQSDCLGSTGEHRELGFILVPCSHVGYSAGLALYCYSDRWREGWFPRGCSVKGRY